MSQDDDDDDDDENSARDPRSALNFSVVSDSDDGE